MKARPILMSAPMVRALLDGRKTQTRRVLKPQPSVAHWQYIQPMHGTSPDGHKFGDWREFRIVGPDYPDSESDSIWCPYGERGDLLWVRETWRGGEPQTESGHCFCEGSYFYKADEHWNKGAGWHPSIHMVRDASRLTLEITEIRAERLQDISEADALAEGFRSITKDNGITWKHGIPDLDGLPGNDDLGWPWDAWEADSRKAYRRLWENINGADSWNANPWVWVIEFKVHRQNVDEFQEARSA